MGVGWSVPLNMVDSMTIAKLQKTTSRKRWSKPTLEENEERTVVIQKFAHSQVTFQVSKYFFLWKKRLAALDDAVSIND